MLSSWWAFAAAILATPALPAGYYAYGPISRSRLDAFARRAVEVRAIPDPGMPADRIPAAA
jgi:hypothetical protein